jgi:hypothetical protein
MSSPPKRGRPRGSPKAERRLTRELSNKGALLELVRSIRDVTIEFTHTATANPVYGLVGAIVTLELLYRARAISLFGYAAGYATIGAMEAAQIGTSIGNALSGVVSAIGNLVPSVGAKGSTGSNATDFIAPSQGWVDARAKGEASSEFDVVRTSGKSKGYVPE